MDTVREGRKPGWFWADNKILDVYAKDIGPHAALVYMALVRHLNAEGQCWPSFQYLADMLGMSRRTVMRAIEALDQAGLITVQERYTDKKGQTTNCYTILDMQDIAAHEPRPASPVPPVTDSHSPHDTQSLPPVTDSHSNKTYMNKTQGTKSGVAANDQDTAVAAALISVGMKTVSARQRRDLLAARPDLTIQEIESWREFIANPPAWCLKPEGKALAALMAREPVPVERTNGNQTQKHQSTAPGYDIHEARRRDAAYTAKHGDPLKGLMA